MFPDSTQSYMVRLYTRENGLTRLHGKCSDHAYHLIGMLELRKWRYDPAREPGLPKDGAVPRPTRSLQRRIVMNKKFAIAWLVIFVAWFFGSYLVHGVLLHDDYAKLPNLFRPEADAQQYFPLMILAHVIMAGAFAWVYSRGIEAKPWLGQGLRFGLVIALLAVVPTYTIYYVVQPMPGILVVKQIVFDGVLLLVLGAVAAFLYRNEKRA